MCCLSEVGEVLGFTRQTPKFRPLVLRGEGARGYYKFSPKVRGLLQVLGGRCAVYGDQRAEERVSLIYEKVALQKVALSGRKIFCVLRDCYSWIVMDYFSTPNQIYELSRKIFRFCPKVSDRVSRLWIVMDDCSNFKSNL